MTSKGLGEMFLKGNFADMFAKFPGGNGGQTKCAETGTRTSISAIFYQILAHFCLEVVALGYGKLALGLHTQVNCSKMVLHAQRMILFNQLLESHAVLRFLYLYLHSHLFKKKQKKKTLFF
jgi:hypothetical protein